MPIRVSRLLEHKNEKEYSEPFSWLASRRANFVRLNAKTHALRVIFMVILLLLLVVPLFLLALEARALLGFGFSVLLIAANLIFGYTIRKKGLFKPTPRERRIRIVVCSGLFTAFVVGTTLRVLLGPLPPHFWIPFVILLVVGGFVGDRIWKKLKGH